MVRSPSLVDVVKNSKMPRDTLDVKLKKISKTAPLPYYRHLSQQKVHPTWICGKKSKMPRDFDKKSETYSSREPLT